MVFLSSDRLNTGLLARFARREFAPNRYDVTMNYASNPTNINKDKDSSKEPDKADKDKKDNKKGKD